MDWENDGTFDTGWSPVKLRNHAYPDTGLRAVRVEVLDGGTLTGAAVHDVLVLPGAAVTLAVWPAAATLRPGETLQFRATAWDSDGHPMDNPGTTWSPVGQTAGGTRRTGLGTASRAAGTHPDVGDAASGSASDTASVEQVQHLLGCLPLAHDRIGLGRDLRLQIASARRRAPTGGIAAIMSRALGQA